MPFSSRSKRSVSRRGRRCGWRQSATRHTTGIRRQSRQMMATTTKALLFLLPRRMSATGMTGSTRVALALAGLGRRKTAPLDRSHRSRARRRTAAPSAKIRAGLTRPPKSMSPYYMCVAAVVFVHVATRAQPEVFAFCVRRCSFAIWNPTAASCFWKVRARHPDDTFEHSALAQH